MSVVGIIVVLAVLAVATAVGLVVRARAGRVRATRPTESVDETSGWALAGLAPDPDDRVLLLQLSSPVCAPCRQTAAALTELAEQETGLRHVEIDVAEDAETARTLHVMRTPTTIAFARDGRELLRVSGVPRRQELLDALDTELAARR
ncbi:thioredoxin family protein [Actinomycetospora endophytica]|uniref:Thioredoxin family protein n=1 Tax=Actinomycetospora endophytica TaxID=2291215 RepID=A0ABS8P7S1_9PSEU|nr:thioredoxin family protein [Actinomycetospora endophytica]MCD2193580.1 thioredoxin family protein [Actinomycetospora endophytica]